LLLLDEPTSGLDPVARREFNALVSSMVKERGTTAFFSSHLVDEVEGIATHVGLIDKGRLQVEADTATLLASARRVVGLAPSPQPSPPSGERERLTMPPGFTCVRDDVWTAAPEAWAAATWPEGVTLEQVSLHDLFLAYARTRSAA
jgi:ABC-2 type transport system ATP-binding protein